MTFWIEVDVVLRTFAGKFLVVMASLVICLLVAEAGVFLLARTGVLPIAKPTYNASSVTFIKDRDWVTAYDRYVGPWHEPDSVFNHKTVCFNRIYRSNAEGMRDPERDYFADRIRVAAVGDDFMEGAGLSFADRITQNMEQLTGLEHLNFGCKDFDPVQYQLILATRASKFSHEGVVVALVPENDFDRLRRRDPPRPGSRHLRPFYSGKKGEYVLHLPNHLVDMGSWWDKLLLNLDHVSVKRILRTYTYTYNAVLYVEGLVKALNREGEEERSGPGEPRSKYYGVSEEHWDLFEHILERIREQAGDRPVLLVTIPRAVDFVERGSYGEPDLPARLQALCDRLGVEYKDLLPEMASKEKDWRRFFISCTGYFTSYGAWTASNILRDTDFYLDLMQKRAGHGVAAEEEGAP